MIAFLPALSILMLAVSTLLLEVAFAPHGRETEDLSHLTDPNPHLEELVTYKALTRRAVARA